MLKIHQKQQHTTTYPHRTMNTVLSFSVQHYFGLAIVVGIPFGVVSLVTWRKLLKSVHTESEHGQTSYDPQGILPLILFPLTCFFADTDATLAPISLFHANGAQLLYIIMTCAIWPARLVWSLAATILCVVFMVCRLLTRTPHPKTTSTSSTEQVLTTH
jgi:hypothetical protein